MSSDIVGRALFGMHLMCVRKEFYFYFFLFSSVCTICAVKRCVLYYDYISLRISAHLSFTRSFLSFVRCEPRSCFVRCTGASSSSCSFKISDVNHSFA